MKYLITILILLLLGGIPAMGQWVQTSGPSGGFVSQLVVNAANGYVYALANNGVYRSTNNGASWVPVTNSFGADMPLYSIAASGTTVYIGSSTIVNPKIVYRSTDNGDTWSQMNGSGLPGYATMSVMLVVGSKLLAHVTTALGSPPFYSSTDGGDTWVASNAGMPANSSAIFLTTKGSDIYAGLSNTVKGIYKSTDNGVNWIPSNTTIGGITGLSANSSYIFVATSTTGVFRSTGNDTAWTKINPSAAIPGTNFTTSVLSTSSNLFIGVGGYMFRADQSGNTWDSIRVGLPQPTSGTAIRSLAASGSSVMLGFASHGIFRSTNNGTNWFKSSAGIKALKINGIYSSNGSLFAAGDADGFFRSSDHGDTWAEINNGLPADAGYYCFARVGTDLLGGTASYKLFRSSDNGDNWTLSNTGFGLTNTFSFWVEGNTVYLTGYPGVAKSTDAGLTWATLPAGYLFYEGGLDIWKDGSNVVTGSNVASHRSTDDGASWATTAGAISTFAQIDSTLFASSSTGVKKSTDHGSTWTATASLPFAVGAQSLTTKGGDLFVGTNDGVYRSTDKGGTWAAINEGWSPKNAVYKMTCDDQYLYAGTTTRSVWRRPLAEITDASVVTINNGWNILSVPRTLPDYRKSSVFPSSSGSAFAYSASGYAATDTLRNGTGYWMKFSGGQVLALAGQARTVDTISVSLGWNLIGSISSPVPVTNIASIPGGMVTSNFFGYGLSYSISDTIMPGSGYWVKASQDGKIVLASAPTASPATRVSIAPSAELPPSPPEYVRAAFPSTTPSAFMLGQNYPNPFNPSTDIRFELPAGQKGGSRFVSLKIYDLLGREVATLVNEVLQPGTHHSRWNASNMPSGIYYYRMIANGFTEVKSMLLAK